MCSFQRGRYTMISEPRYWVCFLFRLDPKTDERMNLIVQEVEDKHPQLVKRTRKEGGLPYHMTMIGGVNIPITECDVMIREVTGVLKPFRDTRWVPKIRDLEPAEMNDNYLGVRLKFMPGSYVLTGNRKKNREIVTRLAPTFHLDSVRHVSCLKVMGGLAEMDIVKPTFIAALEKYRKGLMRMVLTPQVWVKREGVWLCKI